MSVPAPISVVIPCYNAVRYIGATLRSVLAQQVPQLDVVVVDDGSSDGAPELVARDFPQVRLIRQPNQGVAVARNTGIAAARSDWIAFVDADDIWLPGKLQAQWQALQALRTPGQASDQPPARLSYTAWHVWPSTDPEPTAALLAELAAQAGDPARWAGPTGWIYPELLLSCEVWTSTVLAHRSLFEEAGVFDPTLRQGEDWDLWLRASRLTPIVRVPQPLALYRMHPHNITKSVPEVNYAHQVVSRALDRWGHAGPDGRRAEPAAVNRALAQTWSDLAGLCLMAGQPLRARDAARASIAASPRHWPAWKLWAKACARGLIVGRPPV